MILALITGSASACGGFACNLNQPVLQNAEQIVFGVDSVHHEVEMHVQIGYTGDADDFAWIVPVPDVPDLFLTSSALFNQLHFTTAPIFFQRTVDEGVCRDGGGFLFGAGGALKNESASDGANSTGAGGVSVVDQKLVGPYETVTLKADSTAELLQWLSDNDYSLPAGSDAALAPYVSEGGYFVALKLQKDADTGDLSPLALRYPGDKAIIPVQLTSVSATPDMRLEVYVFSDTRAVPESYLHVKINEAAINWATGGQNYANVITQAANEAGGRAFATDYYGSSDKAGTLFDPSRWSEGETRASSSPRNWAYTFLYSLPSTSEMAEVAEDHVSGIPDGATFLSCPGCYPYATWIDGVDAATDDLVTRVVEPLQVAQDLLDAHPMLTRMTSSMSAVEMTVDPVFVLNHDMADDKVPNRHTSKMVYECGNGRDRSASPRRFELRDGVVIDLPSQDWMDNHHTTDFRYIREHDLADTNAEIIEQTGATGQPQVLVDHTDDLLALADAANRALGCACDSSRPAGGATGVAGILLTLALRRRKA